MFTLKMLLYERWLQPGRLRVDLFSELGHTGYFLEHLCVVHCLVRSLAQCKMRMVAYQYHFHFLVRQVAFLKSVNSLDAGLVLIISADHLIAQRRRSGHVYCEVIGMCVAEDGNIALSLCPGRSVCRMCM